MARWRFAVLLLSLLSAALALEATVARLTINTSTTDMLSAELPFRRNAEGLRQAFPQFTDTLSLVVEADSARTASEAAEQLYAALQARPETFRDVFYAPAEPFFRRNGLLYLETAELQALADRLAEAQPLLGELAADPSLRGLGHVLALAGRAEDPTALAALAPALERFAAVAESAADGNPRPLSWQALLTGEEPGEEDRRQILTVQPALDYGTLAPVADAAALLRQIASEVARDSVLAFGLRLTGSPIMFQEELESVRQNIGLVGLLSAILVGIILWLGLRSVRLVAAILITLAVGLVWTACFATFAVGELNLISVAFAVLFIGLSVDFGIHFALRAREAVTAGKATRAALVDAGSAGGPVLGLCALSTAIGFLAFLPTDYRGLAELGMISAGGIAIALFANLTLLPALMALLPPRPRGGDALGRLPGVALRAETWFVARARAVVAVAAALAIAAAFALPFARFDDDPLNLRDPRSESVATLVDLLDDPRIEPYDASYLAPDLATAEVLAERFARLPEVAEATTLADLVPSGQEAKLAVIEDMSFYLAPLFGAQAAAPPDDSARAAAVAAMVGDLSAVPAPLDGPARRFAAALEKLAGDPAALARLERLLLGGFERRLADLSEALGAEEITFESLPASLRERSLAADGRALIQILPKEDLRDQEARRRFVDALQSVAPGVTGAPITITEAGRAVVLAFLEAAGIAVALVTLLLAVLLRSVTATLAVLAPLALAALLTVAATVVLRLPFNFANVIVLPLLFGIGIDSGLHLVARFREEASGTLAATSTPRAVLLSALTTIASFCSLALSSHRGTASMGILLTIAIGFTLATTLLLLPSLLALLQRGARGAGR